MHTHKTIHVYTHSLTHTHILLSHKTHTHTLHMCTHTHITHTSIPPQSKHSKYTHTFILINCWYSVLNLLLLLFIFLMPSHFTLPSCTNCIYLNYLVPLHIDLALVLPVYSSILVYFTPCVTHFIFIIIF